MGIFNKIKSAFTRNDEVVDLAKDPSVKAKIAAIDAKRAASGISVDKKGYAVLNAPSPSYDSSYSSSSYPSATSSSASSGGDFFGAFAAAANDSSSSSSFPMSSFDSSVSSSSADTSSSFSSSENISDAAQERAIASQTPRDKIRIIERMSYKVEDLAQRIDLMEKKIDRIERHVNIK